MITNEIVCEWKEGTHFDAQVSGHTISLDSPPVAGPNPKPLLLVALAGCTGMDVAELMKKMRIDFKGLRIKVTGELTEEHPKVYSKAHVIYEIIGGNPDHDKVEKAVHLSEEKYCGVSAMLKKAMEITWEIRYVGE